MPSDTRRSMLVDPDLLSLQVRTVGLSFSGYAVTYNLLVELPRVARPPDGGRRNPN